MATPALRALRKHFGPEAHLVGVMRPYVAEVLAGSSWFDDVVTYAKRPGPGECERPAGDSPVAGREAGSDSAAHQFVSHGLDGLAQRGAASGSAIAASCASWLLTRRFAPPMNASDRIAAGDARRLFAARRRRSAARPSRRGWSWPRRRPMKRRPTGSGSGSACRRAATSWCSTRAARSAARRTGRPSILPRWPGGSPPTGIFRCSSIAGPKERDTAREIVALAGDRRVVSLAEERELPIGLTKACIRRARMLVTTDSGPRYLGIAFERPVVTLFGPTDPRLVETHYERETCLSLGLECQPCMERDVPARASSLHAGFDGGHGVCGGGDSISTQKSAEHAA